MEGESEEKTSSHGYKEILGFGEPGVKGEGLESAAAVALWPHFVAMGQRVSRPVPVNMTIRISARFGSGAP